MTKLNYNVNLPKKEDEDKQYKLNSSLNALSKQSVINQSLSSRMPQGGAQPSNTQMVTSSGFGRTNA